MVTFLAPTRSVSLLQRPRTPTYSQKTCLVKENLFSQRTQSKNTCSANSQRKPCFCGRSPVQSKNKNAAELRSKNISPRLHVPRLSGQLQRGPPVAAGDVHLGPRLSRQRSRPTEPPPGGEREPGPLDLLFLFRGGGVIWLSLKVAF